MKPSLPPRLEAPTRAAADLKHGERCYAWPSVIEAARPLVAEYEAWLRPATARERIVILIGLANMVGKPDVLRTGTEAEQGQFWQTYHRLLADIPARVLQEAVDDFLRSPPPKGDREPRQLSHGVLSKWFPEPGTLLGLCRANYAWKDDARLLRGLKALAVARPKNPHYEAVKATLSEENERRLADFRGRLSAAIADEKAADEAARSKSLVRVRPDGRATLMQRPWAGETPDGGA